MKNRRKWCSDNCPDMSKYDITRTNDKRIKDFEFIPTY
jgi:hypothetical protein